MGANGFQTAQSDLFSLWRKTIRQEAERCLAVLWQEVSKAYIIGLYSSVKSQVGWGWGCGCIILRSSFSLSSKFASVGMEPGLYSCEANSPPQATPSCHLTSFDARELLASVGEFHSSHPKCHYVIQLSQAFLWLLVVSSEAFAWTRLHGPWKEFTKQTLFSAFFDPQMET